MTKLILILALTSAAQLAKAQLFEDQIDHFNPVMQTQSEDPQANRPDPDWNRDFMNQFKNVRIKVFPHNSKYNGPQGKDSTLDKLKINSAGTCNVFKSNTPTSEGDISRDVVLNTGKTFDFTPKTLPNPVWIECTDSIEIVRPDYPANPIRYQGVIFLKTVGPASAPYITAVNVLPFESYLKGVVPSEMPASWSAEALKAQAVAARTYAYHELGMDVASDDQNILLENSGAQIDDTVTYQAYLGLKNASASTNKAIEDTTGRVMTNNAQVIKAYFHADSGGYTENAENVWSHYYPYILAKEELYPDGSIPGTQWSYTPNFSEVEQKLTDNKLINAGQNIINLRVDADDIFKSGRPQYVTIVFSDKTEKKILAVDFSFAMRIKSQWVRFSNTQANAITINGRGFGHGAGMNQWGARIMADKLNKNFEEILKFYYSAIEITQ